MLKKIIKDEMEYLMVSQLVGIWNLRSFVARDKDGQELKPWGESPVGKLFYDQSGQMAVVMSQPNRPRFRSPRPFEGSSEEVKAAFENLEAYAGRFEIDSSSGVITHHVEVCRMPNWEGHPQVRRYEIDGDWLVLHTPLIEVEGTQWTFSFSWTRDR
jgi:hypothetical protein